MSYTTYGPSAEWTRRYNAKCALALDMWRELDRRYQGRMVTTDNEIWRDIGRKLGAQGAYWTAYDSVAYPGAAELYRFEGAYGEGNAGGKPQTTLAPVLLMRPNQPAKLFSSM